MNNWNGMFGLSSFWSLPLVRFLKKLNIDSLFCTLLRVLITALAAFVDIGDIWSSLMVSNTGFVLLCPRTEMAGSRERRETSGLRSSELTLIPKFYKFKHWNKLLW